MTVKAETVLAAAVAKVMAGQGRLSGKTIKWIPAFAGMTIGFALIIVY